MLSKQNNKKAATSILFTGLLTLLASCANSSAVESLVKADPKLTANNVQQESDVAASDKLAPPDASQDTEEITTEDSVDTSMPERSPEKIVANEASDSKPTSNNLPEGFPSSFPIYPQAELSEVKTAADTKSGVISWSSLDNRKAIADYYQAQWEVDDWEIIQPFIINPDRKFTRAIAIKDEQRVALTLLTSSDSEPQGTNLTAVYQPLSEEVARSGISDAIAPETELEPNTVKPAKNQAKAASDPTPEEQVELSAENQDYEISTANFADLEEAPEQLNQPVATVASLGILTPYTGQNNTDLNKFAPNAVITRGEYARWLIEANNRYYQDDPGKKIYVAKDSEQPAFQDIAKAHPDFGAIQSLAEAGLIPSRLTQDSTKLLFRPDAPLTREDLVTWKVPLDMRQALPKASIEAIRESWGFQDAADIDSSAIRALYADFQNGDRSNIRRVFGFTTLFQPNKPVTRAEAAASLWYFGFQGDGITAQEVWDTELKTE